MREPWTPQMELLLKSRYPDEGASEALSAAIGRSPGSVRKMARKFGIHVKDRRAAIRAAQAKWVETQARTAETEAFRLFGSWNPVNAYVFGVMWGDGCLHDEGITHGTQLQDEAWMRKVGEWFKPDIHVGNTKKVMPSGAVCLGKQWEYSNARLYGVLEPLGLLRRKSFLDPPYPNVPDEFFSPFSRGVLDSDGTVGDGFAWLGTKQFVEMFRQRMIDLWSVSNRVSIESHGSVFRIGWTKLSDVVVIYDRLYEAAAGWFYLGSRKKPCV